MDSTLDLLQRAALRLSQEGTIKDRLVDAYTLHLSDVDADGLPELVRNEFIAMCDALHRERPLPRESVIRASVRKMSNDEARQYAALVVRAFAALAREEVAGAGIRRPPIHKPMAPILQLFAEG